MIFLILIILANVLVLGKLNFLPYPELFVYPYLTNHGLIPYEGILDQHFPGLMFFPVNLGNLGMQTPGAARLWQYGIVVITHLLIYLVARKFFKSNSKALTANLFFLLWQPFFEGWVLWIDSFLPIFTLSALYFYKSKKIFWSGFFLGLALLFKQVLIPLIGLVGLYILFKERKLKPLLIFTLGVAIPSSFLVFYITNLGIWKDFIFWTITFNMTTFAEMGRKYGNLSEWVRVAGVYGFSLLAFLDRKIREDIIIIGLFLIGSLAAIYARFDFIHLQPSLPFAALLSAYSVNFLMKNKNLKYLIVLYALAAIFLLSQFYRANWGGRIFFFGDTERAVATRVQKLSGPADRIFAFGTFPHIYQMAMRLPPGDVFVFQFPWFMIEAEDRVLKGLFNDPPVVVVRDRSSQVEGKNLVLFMPRIDSYISDNYKVLEKIEEMEIMIQK